MKRSCMLNNATISLTFITRPSHDELLVESQLLTSFAEQKLATPDSQDSLLARA